MLLSFDAPGEKHYECIFAESGGRAVRVPHFVLLGLGVVFGAGLYFDKPVDLSETQEKVTITYWEKWTGFESEAMRGAVELFNSKKIKNHKGQVIECHYTSITHIENKATLAIAGG